MASEKKATESSGFDPAAAWADEAKARKREQAAAKRRAAAAAKRAEADGAVPPMEVLFTDPAWFGVRAASPLQRAWCRIADGRSLGDLADDPVVVAALAPSVPVSTWRALLWGSQAERAHAASTLDRRGVDAWERAVATAPPGMRPSHVVIVAGVRSGKTVFAACSVVRSGALAELRHAVEGDVPRVSFASLTTDLATQAYRYLSGASLGSPRVNALLRGQPSAGRLVLEPRPGQPVEVMVVAASQAGASLAARWSAGVVFDEAPRMGGRECAVSYDDMRAVAEERRLPGAQIVSIGSPWAALGPVYELARKRAGEPSMDLVVLRAPAPAANPQHWTRERVERMEAAAEQDGTAHIVEASVWAQWLENADEVLYPSRSIDACIRPQHRDAPRPDGSPAVATMDPATRRNAWTLVVAVRDQRTGVLRVAAARQWRGSSGEPLDAATMLAAIRDECARWGVSTVYSDQWSGDALTSLGQTLQGGRLTVCQVQLGERERWEAADALRLALGGRKVELPPDPVLLDDLRRARKRLTRTGVTLDLPETPDGRHCDYTPALVLAWRHAPPWTGAPAAPEPDALERGLEPPLEDVLDQWSLGL